MTHEEADYKISQSLFFIYAYTGRMMLHTSGEFGLFPGGGVCSEEKNRKEKEERREREAQ